MKSVILAGLLVAGFTGNFAMANEQDTQSSDGVLKYSYNFVYLKCESSSCGDIVTRRYPMKVYYKFVPDIPPHSEVRIYWNKNVPAGVSAGKRVAHTEGATCPDGSKMKAKWFLDSSFRPTTAIATDCNGVDHTYSVHEFHF
ncbi:MULTISPECIES: hypothetical protein [Pseudoalteromonas]|uniref:Uncharacterized protein n=1 Tax=Pseudoalteromonas obscura TaxID=3048491 RepID=A0ABT7ENH8_9GAMM|nr:MULTISPECIES: hypothetical protein [Pseudoalteromonas]MBQ4835209.1 hypothetical protein [Pseudoalteromonas luteoviolacea]MDK2596604.1 hypothetical protein [Pseudoalteromonas sp. P94(2023)]